MDLTYTECGEYLIPNFSLPEQPHFGKYGMLRKTFLKTHRPGIYTTFLLSGQLQEHLSEVDEATRERIALIIAHMKTVQGATEALKASDQVTWVGKMNAIKQAAEEVALTEVVYV